MYEQLRSTLGSLWKPAQCKCEGALVPGSEGAAPSSPGPIRLGRVPAPQRCLRTGPCLGKLSRAKF